MLRTYITNKAPHDSQFSLWPDFESLRALHFFFICIRVWKQISSVTNSWLWSFYLFILITKCQKTKHTIHTEIYKLSYKTRGELFGSKPLKNSIFQSCWGAGNSGLSVCFFSLHCTWINNNLFLTTFHISIHSFKSRFRATCELRHQHKPNFSLHKSDLQPPLSL